LDAKYDRYDSVTGKGTCCVDGKGYPSLDADGTADADGNNAKFSLKIERTDATALQHGVELPASVHYKDTFGRDHPATQGSLTADSDNSRYVLACPQVSDGFTGMKSIKMTITRDKDLTAFGSEWVKLFEKDSWSNKTVEWEPFTFNEYGAKVPFLRWKPEDGLSSDADKSGELSVFMEIAEKGDFEIMYGNPNLKYTHTDGEEYWVPVRFGSTLLRVGNPWAGCTDSTLDATEKPIVGIIMPLLFGGPNTAADVAIKKDSDGTASAENYNDVIDELKSAGNNGLLTDQKGDKVEVYVVLEIFGRDILASKFATTEDYTDSGCEKTEYENADPVPEKCLMCYKAGNKCPEKHSVCSPSNCEIDVWKSLINGFQTAHADGDIKVLGSVKSTAVLDLYEAQALGLNGYFYTTGKGSELDGVPSGHPAGKIKVLALGQPLFDAGRLDQKDDGKDESEADVFVTLADSDLGAWNPYSWYSTTDSKKWAALVTHASEANFTKSVDELVDRGYGWIYATTQGGDDAFGLKNEHTLGDLLAKTNNPTLKEPDAGSGSGSGGQRRLTELAPYWGCDDTLFMCKPICLRKTGVVTTKVADYLCTSAPMDQCACKCHHEAQWTCDGDAVVCKAKEGEGELKTVGDKVCEIRGAPKPASTAELRIASTCEPVTEMRGDAPTSQCLAQWATTTTAPTEAPEPTEAPTEAATSEDGAKVSVPVIQESFAAAMAFLALAVYA
jgi:hypothetical protein